MRIALLLCIAAVCVFSGCHVGGPSINRVEAQKMSDSYMSDVIADRVDLALDKMEVQIVQVAGGKANAEAGLRNLFNYCGRPWKAS
jgi:hypothetical protein